MNDLNKGINPLTSLLLLGYLLGLLSLLAPSTALIFNGQKIFQYPMSGYLGQVVFGLIIVTAALSGYPVLRKNTARTWPCLPAALILLGYSVAEFQQIMGLFEPMAENLTQYTNAKISLSYGWYGCFLAGMILFVKWSYGRNQPQKPGEALRTPQ